jgi:hypothetical protein
MKKALIPDSGAAPVIVGCGNHSLTNTANGDRCTVLRELQFNSSCESRMQSQFHSVNIEFSI